MGAAVLHGGPSSGTYHTAAGARLVQTGILFTYYPWPLVLSMLALYYHNNGWAFCVLITLAAGVVNTVITLLVHVAIITDHFDLSSHFLKIFEFYCWLSNHALCCVL